MKAIHINLDWPFGPAKYLQQPEESISICHAYSTPNVSKSLLLMTVWWKSRLYYIFTCDYTRASEHHPSWVGGWETRSEGLPMRNWRIQNFYIFLLNIRWKGAAVNNAHGANLPVEYNGIYQSQESCGTFGLFVASCGIKYFQTHF